jgi:hypothetical protein
MTEPPAEKLREEEIQRGADTFSHPLKMGVFELRLVLQAEAQEPVQANMADPDDAEPQIFRAVQSPESRRKEQRQDIGVNEIVADRAHARIDQVAEHRKVRGQKQKQKQSPARLEVEIDIQTGKKNGSAFQVKEQPGFP